MLTTETTALIIIDIQGKLAQLMYRKETLFENLQKIVKGAKILGLPILWIEQNPAGLGPTVPEIADLLADLQPISKLSFSCCANDCFMEELKALDRGQLLVAGIEAHVCVYQTTVDLVSHGYEVQVVADAVSSRTADNRETGLARMSAAGATLTSAETALFELLKVAQGAEFKAILKVVK